VEKEAISSYIKFCCDCVGMKSRLLSLVVVYSVASILQHGFIRGHLDLLVYSASL